MLITADTIVTGAELLRPGWVEVDRGRGHRRSAPGAPPRPGRPATWARPPWCPDSSTCTSTAAEAGRSPRRREDSPRAAVELHRRHGTTTMVASLVVGASRPSCCSRCGVLADQVRGRPGRRHPPGGPLAVQPAVRRPRAVRAAATRIRRSSTGCWRRSRRRSGWSPSPRSGTARWPPSGGSSTPASRGRCRAHRRHLRAGARGDRRRGDRGHPPVQRDAAGAPP